jgi:ribokinase
MRQNIDWDVVVVGDVARKGQAGALGKAASEALAAARLGARTALIGKLGGDGRTRALCERLASEGIGLRHVVQDGQGGGATAAAGTLGIDDVRSASAALVSTRVLLLDLEAPTDSLVAAVQIARNEGLADAAIILDAAPAGEIPDELLAELDLLKVSELAARMLTGIEVRDEESAREMAAALFERGVGTVAAQVGTRHMLLWPEGERWLPDLDVLPLGGFDRGEAFAAWLAVAMSRGQEVDTLPEELENTATLPVE